MTLREETRVYENGGRKGAAAYLPGDLLADRVCPLEHGQAVFAQIVPGTAVVLYPSAVNPEYPVDLALEDPERIESELTQSYENQLCRED